MKYYGIKKRNEKEYRNFRLFERYRYYPQYIPGKNQKNRQESYRMTFCDHRMGLDFDNSIPEGKQLLLTNIFTSDLLLRENVQIIKKGLNRLLKELYSNRFITGGFDGVDDFLRKIEKMDSTLSVWYNSIECGPFEFKKGCKARENIDYFMLYIKNINSSFLSVEANIILTDSAQKKFKEIAYSKFAGFNKFVHSTLGRRANSIGCRTSRTVVSYNEDARKADELYEYIGCIKWEFYDELERYFPIILHKKGIEPPSINVLNTDIHYAEIRDRKRPFWESIGIREYSGQFIDEYSKMIFNGDLSGRYDEWNNYNLTLIMNKSRIPEEKRIFCDSTLDYHLTSYGYYYFKFIFLDILSRYLGKTIIKHKYKLDKIKLQKRKFGKLIKQRYKFERDIDLYKRYIRDDIWTQSERKLTEIYGENERIRKNAIHDRTYSYKNFIDKTLAEKNTIERRINDLEADFEEKINILEHLSAYKVNWKNWVLSLLMLVLAAATLFFVLYPDLAPIAGTYLHKVLEVIRQWLKNIL